jgi:DNA processing protein
MKQACQACMRRAFVVGRLAPRIASALGPARTRRVPGLLTLTDDELIAAVAGDGREEVRQQVARFDRDFVEAKLEAAQLTAVCRHASAYPQALHALSDPPAALFSTAAPAELARLLGEPATTIVGTRRPSPYGLEMAYSLGRGLGAAGITVVSGLALGIDAAVHRGCLDAGGAAVAVLAGGADVPYPRRNRKLYEQVRESGAVLAEMPPGQRAFRWSFPARNRIMAGLAGMTVVVEAADPSGSLITAEFAQQLGRTVGAVPGRATAWTAAGTNGLLGDGARLVTGPEDVLDELLGIGVERPAVRPAPRRPEDPVLDAVLAAVEGGADVDAVCRQAALSAANARVALARLEAEGYVVRSGLGSYERAAER